MADSIRRWLAGGEGKWATVVGGVLLILATLAAVLAAALIALSRAPRVTYYCIGESPRPCTCFREGEEPAGFMFNRVSTGAAHDTTVAGLVVLGVGLVCIVAWFVHRRSRSHNTQAPEGVFKLLLPIGLVLTFVGLAIPIMRGPAPCEDQGALGPVSALSGACHEWAQ
ncbi:MAG: hypothetical protein ACM3MM_06115 [Acidobacteriota bacterium]